MGLFKKLAGLLGIARDDNHRDDASLPPPPSVPAEIDPAQILSRKGFSVAVKVPVDRPPPPPLLVFCPAGDGGLQGLRWYARRLRIDEDGDIADEFLDEVSPGAPTSTDEHGRTIPRFKAKFNTIPAKVKNLALLPNGKIHHLVEYEGRLEWL